MKVQVRMFAITRELTGTEQVAMDLPDGATVSDLKSALLQVHPQLASVIEHVMIAVDSEYAGPGQVLVDGCELALIPPVSGG